MNNTSQWNTRIETYLDGTLSVEETRLLLERVEADPAFRREMARRMRMHGMLTAVLHADASCAQMADVVETAVTEGRFESRVMKKITRLSHPAHPMRRGRGSQRRRTASGRQKSQENRTARRTLSLKPWYAKGATWTAAAACLLLIAGAWFMNQREGERFQSRIVAEILEREGQARLLRGGAVLSLDARTELEAGDRIETQTGRVRFQMMHDGSRVEAGADAVLTVAPSSLDATLIVQAGGVQCRVRKQKPGHTFTVDTPHAKATVVGTAFGLDVKPTTTHLTVTEGAVRFEPLSASAAGRIVRAGQTAQTHADNAVALQQHLQKTGTEDILPAAGEDLPVLVNENWSTDRHRWIICSAELLNGKAQIAPARAVATDVRTWKNGETVLEIDGRKELGNLVPCQKIDKKILSFTLQPGEGVLDYDFKILAYKGKTGLNMSPQMGGTLAKIVSRRIMQQNKAPFHPKFWYHARLEFHVTEISDNRWRVIFKHYMRKKADDPEKRKLITEAEYIMSGGHVFPIITVSGVKMAVGRIVLKANLPIDTGGKEINATAP